MAIDTNAINGIIQQYSFESLPQFIADLPPKDLWAADFSDAIGTAGSAVNVQLPNTQYPTLNSLKNGWGATSASAANVQVNIQSIGLDQLFNVDQWNQMTPAKIINAFGDHLGKAVVNGLFVNAINNISSSTFTNTAYVASSSLFNLTGSLITSTGTGSSGLQGIGGLLDALEVGQTGRYVVLNPKARQGLKSQLYPQYVYGDQSVVRDGGYKDTKGNVINSAYPAWYVDNFNVFMSPRLFGATLQNGGDKYSSNDKLVGFAGVKGGLAVAARTPILPDFGGSVFSTVVVEPTSGFPMQFGLVVDPSKPGYRLFAYTMFGSAAGNTNAIVPIITQSN